MTRSLFRLGELALPRSLAVAVCWAISVAVPARAADQIRPSAVPVNTVKASNGRLPKIIAGIGTVAPLKSVNVRPRSSAQVTSIGFQEGQFVAKGDFLVQLDTRELEAALRSATAKKEQDDAQFGGPSGTPSGMARLPLVPSCRPRRLIKKLR